MGWRVIKFSNYVSC